MDGVSGVSDEGYRESLRRMTGEPQNGDRMNEWPAQMSEIREAHDHEAMAREAGNRPGVNASPRPPPPTIPPAETEAMGQMLMEAINREVAIRTRLIEAERLLKAEVER